MENKTLKFKTNINCDGCVTSVKPHLDTIAGTSGWHVDTSDKDKILTIKTEGITRDQIMEAVQKAGFKIELLNV